MRVMLLFFEDGEEDIVLKVQKLIRSVTRIDYMEMPQFETQSTSSALEIRENQRRVFCYGQEILLTKTEYEILLYVYKNANHVLTHGQIYERVWREPDYGEARKTGQSPCSNNSAQVRMGNKIIGMRFVVFGILICVGNIENWLNRKKGSSCSQKDCIKSLSYGMTSFMIRINPNPLPTGARFGFIRCGGDKRDRTADLLNAIQALSQLSYTPNFFRVSLGRFTIIPHPGEKCKPFFQKIENFLPAGKV